MKAVDIFIRFLLEYIQRNSYHKHVLNNSRFSDFTHVLQGCVVDQEGHTYIYY